MINKQNQFVNHLDLNANLMLPSGKNQTLILEQTAPGRYACPFPAEEIGASFLSIYSTANDKLAKPRTFGFGIPYTEEFNSTTVNTKLMELWSASTKGQVLSIEDVPANLFENASDSKEYHTPLWPHFIMLFLVLLMADVAVRKFLNVDG